MSIRRPSSAPRAFGAVLLLVAVALLAACGFRPLKAERDGESPVVQRLSQVKIELIDNRIGQELRNELLNRLSPEGKPTHPIYSLEVKLQQSRTEVDINKDNTASRAALLVTADFTLKAIESDKKLLEGRIQSDNTYGINLNSYATVVAGQDVQKRMMASIADDIALRLGLYFDREPGEP